MEIGLQSLVRTGVAEPRSALQFRQEGPSYRILLHHSGGIGRIFRGGAEVHALLLARLD